MSRSKPHRGLTLHASRVAEGSAQSTGGCGREEPPMPRSINGLTAGTFSFPLWLPEVSDRKVTGADLLQGLCHVKLWLGPQEGTCRTIPPSLCGVLSPAPHYTVQSDSFRAAYLCFLLDSFFSCCFFFLIVGYVLDTHPFIKSVINLVSLQLFKSGLRHGSVHPRLVREIT